MVPNSGSLYLLGLQGAALATATFRLLTGAVFISSTTTWAALAAQEASWPGYAPAVAGAWAAPYLSGNQALMEPSTYPSFTVSSGPSQSPTGYALVAADGVTLIDAGPFPTPPVMLAGVVYYLSYALSDEPG